MTQPEGADEARAIAQRAIDAVTGDRNADYGHPALDFAAQAFMVRGYLLARFGLDLEIEPRDIPNLMSLVKIARDAHRPKADNAIDAIGYQLTKVLEHVKRTGEPYPE